MAEILGGEYEIDFGTLTVVAEWRYTRCLAVSEYWGVSATHQEEELEIESVKVGGQEIKLPKPMMTYLHDMIYQDEVAA